MLLVFVDDVFWDDCWHFALRGCGWRWVDLENFSLVASVVYESVVDQGAVQVKFGCFVI